jgi:hypothetical protein
MKPDSRKITPEAQLRSFIAKFSPKEQKLIRSVRAAMRKRFPTANELAYDYGFSLVIGYSPTDRGIESIVSIATRDGGVRLYLMHGPKLPDPKKLLLGSGKQARYIEVDAVSRLAHPDVKALIAAAVEQAQVSLPSKGKGSLIIKSGSGKKRPRKKPKK